MNKVFVLTYSIIYHKMRETHVVGVFSSEKLAKKAIDGELKTVGRTWEEGDIYSCNDEEFNEYNLRKVEIDKILE